MSAAASHRGTLFSLFLMMLMLQTRALRFVDSAARARFVIVGRGDAMQKADNPPEYAIRLLSPAAPPRRDFVFVSATCVRSTFLHYISSAIADYVPLS